MTEPSTPYRFGLRLSERGCVAGIGDGIAWIRGLPSARLDELIGFDDGSSGLVFQLGKEVLGAILLSQSRGVTAGMAVQHIGRKLEIGVGDALLGRVVDPLGSPLDGLPPPQIRQLRPLEAAAPSIIERDFVSEPFYTGCKIVDSLIPIGKGQRQLIIGDDGVGKSALALDAVLNQRGRNVLCVMVLIGQPRSSVAGTLEALRAAGALDYTVLVVAEANALPGFRYLAPFAGCAIAEHWMRLGRDTLVVYDDLTRHAQSYRELSLLLQRPPGREAYPGDIFYLHSRLLERSTVLSLEHGGGSMTALPIIETRQGELSAYIPTNLISITDGQIYFESKLFAAGILPAIDIGRSVSRIGGKAQHPAIKNAAAHIRLDYLQFLELELFARFGTRLEASVEQKLQRGRLLREILKQDRLQPLSEQAHLAWLLAYGEGLLADVAPEQAATVLAQLLQQLPGSALKLDSPKQQWLAALKQWLAHKP
ncbi:F0F1 ATP synthase subunit alpha [Methylomonas koyamae]|uniref:ATP synthase subunit alpha n=1 Tax=Methylomonas koyamae TaxID=702114 RepID=A0A177MZ32_9GAMM|nr:F0F1 ATP synthase subunit alpha [Methylomonas koyamae]OAI10967.1 F0F1 ATP synthase subunit alpha [Methylomonas koyamae]OAI28365.1 F0F1 ATP synthase subunit alpha [Methylomonas koyamae]WNB73918.1 F0F1 ATP synthase subunit alpha [Methylomonas koyamae]